MLPTLRKNDGFTLVEVLAAVVILAIGLMAIVAACQAGRDTQRRAVYMAVGRDIAQSAIEGLRTAQFDSVLAQAGDTDWSASSLPAGNRVVVSVARYPDAFSTRLCRVSVRVTWPEAAGTREIYYETLIARQ